MTITTPIGKGKCIIDTFDKNERTVNTTLNKLNPKERGIPTIALAGAGDAIDGGRDTAMSAGAAATGSEGAATGTAAATGSEGATTGAAGIAGSEGTATGTAAATGGNGATTGAVGTAGSEGTATGAVVPFPDAYAEEIENMMNLLSGMNDLLDIQIEIEGNAPHKTVTVSEERHCDLDRMAHKNSTNSNMPSSSDIGSCQVNMRTAGVDTEEAADTAGGAEGRAKGGMKTQIPAEYHNRFYSIPPQCLGCSRYGQCDMKCVGCPHVSYDSVPLQFAISVKVVQSVCQKAVEGRRPEEINLMNNQSGVALEEDTVVEVKFTSGPYAGQTLTAVFAKGTRVPLAAENSCLVKELPEAPAAVQDASEEVLPSREAEDVHGAKDLSTAEVPAVAKAAVNDGNSGIHEKGCTLEGVFPSDLKGPRQYGSNTMILAAILHDVGFVSYERTATIISNYTGFTLNRNTAGNLVARVEALATVQKEKIDEKLKSEPVLNCDETGLGVNGSTYWAHIACNDKYTSITVKEKRGYSGIKAANVIPNYKGIIVHDCLSSYWKFTEVTHAICLQHILRELLAIIMFFATGETLWARLFFHLIRLGIHMRNVTVRNGKEEVDPRLIELYESCYRKIIILGMIETPEVIHDDPKKKGRKPGNKRAAFLRRMNRLFNEACLFLHNLQVSPTNNRAEAGFRMFKLRNKVGKFRSPACAQIFADVYSYIDTARKQGHNAVDAFRALVYGGAEELIGV